MFKPFLVFACVGKHLDLARAAAELGMSEAAVSRQLDILETDCGTSLYRRTNGALELTEAGEKLLERIGAFLARSGDPKKASVNGAAERRSGQSGRLGYEREKRGSRIGDRVRGPWVVGRGS
jgi:DNA-binding transcriptional LysR family regulator